MKQNNLYLKYNPGAEIIAIPFIVSRIIKGKNIKELLYEIINALREKAANVKLNELEKFEAQIEYNNIENFFATHFKALENSNEHTFEDKIKKSYSDKLELYNDQKVKILSLEPYNNSRLQLKTELVGKEGTYSINYNFYEKDGEWFIYDVDLIGVSIIQTYRQQFGGLLKEKSFDEMFAQFKNQ